MHLGFVVVGLHVLQAANSERASLLLVADASGVLAEGDRSDMELLDVVDGADRELAFLGDGQTVGECGGIEGAHVADLLEVDVAVEELLVAAVDDGRPVRGGKHVDRVLGGEGPESDGLGPEGDLFPVAQFPRGGVQREVEKVPVSQGAEEIRHAFELAEEDGSRDYLSAQEFLRDEVQRGEREDPDADVRPHSDGGEVAAVGVIIDGVDVETGDLVFQLNVLDLRQFSVLDLQVDQVPPASCQENLQQRRIKIDFFLENGSSKLIYASGKVTCL